MSFRQRSVVVSFRSVVDLGPAKITDMQRTTCLKIWLAVSAISCAAQAADAARPLQLYVDLAVDLAREKEISAWELSWWNCCGREAREEWPRNSGAPPPIALSCCPALAALPVYRRFTVKVMTARSSRPCVSVPQFPNAGHRHTIWASKTGYSNCIFLTPFSGVHNGAPR